MKYERDGYKSWFSPNYRIRRIGGRDYNFVLQKGVEIIESLGYECWLSAGTMMGIYRDGQPIEVDTDLDVGMFAISTEERDKLKAEFNNQGFDDIRITSYNGEPMQLAMIHKEVIFDIYFYHKKEKTVDNYNDYGWMHKPMDLLNPLHEITYNGKKYKCPRPVPYLRWRYGEDWNIPNRNSDDWSQMQRGN